MAELKLSDVTKAPKMRPLKTADGVQTGIFETLEPSVAMDGRARAIPIAKGSLLTAPVSGGFHGALGQMSECRKTPHGFDIHYRF